MLLRDGRVLYGRWAGVARGGRRPLATACGELAVPTEAVQASSPAAEGEAPGDLAPGTPFGVTDRPPEDLAGVWLRVESRYFEFLGDVPRERLAFLARRADEALEYQAGELGLAGRLAAAAARGRRPYVARVFADFAAYERWRELDAPEFVRQKSRAFLDGSRGFYGSGIALYDPGLGAAEAADLALDTLHHECAHLVIDRLARGPEPPLWVTEGIATLYTELRWTGRSYAGTRLPVAALRRAIEIARGGGLSLAAFTEAGLAEFEWDQYALAAAFAAWLESEGEAGWRALLEALDAGAGDWLEPVAAALDTGAGGLELRLLVYLEREGAHLLTSPEKLALDEHAELARAEARSLRRLGRFEEAARVCRRWLERSGAERRGADHAELARLLAAVQVEAYALRPSRERLAAARAAVDAGLDHHPLDAGLARVRAELALEALRSGAAGVDEARTGVGFALILAAPGGSAFPLLVRLASALGSGEEREEARALLAACAPPRAAEVEAAFLEALLDSGEPEDRARWLSWAAGRLEGTAQEVPRAVDPALALDAAAVARGLGRPREAVSWARRAAADLEPWWTTGPFAETPDAALAEPDPAELESAARRLMRAGRLEAEGLMQLRDYDGAEAVLARMRRTAAAVPELEAVWSERLAALARRLGVSPGGGR